MTSAPPRCPVSSALQQVAVWATTRPSRARKSRHKVMGAKGSTIADVLMAIVFVALATTLVAHPNTAKDIAATGNAFSGSIKAATGK